MNVYVYTIVRAVDYKKACVRGWCIITKPDGNVTIRLLFVLSIRGAAWKVNLYLEAMRSLTVR